MRVLVLCYNKLLAQHLATALADTRGVRVSTFHGWGVRCGPDFQGGEGDGVLGERLLGPAAGQCRPARPLRRRADRPGPGLAVLLVPLCETGARWAQAPHRYHLLRRLEASREMLRIPDARIAEIATAVGFADQAHFTRQFTKGFGLTSGL